MTHAAGDQETAKSFAPSEISKFPKQSHLKIGLKVNLSPSEIEIRFLKAHMNEK